MKRYFVSRIENTLRAHAEIVKKDTKLTKKERIEQLQVLQHIYDYIKEIEIDENENENER